MHFFIIWPPITEEIAKDFYSLSHVAQFDKETNLLVAVSQLLELFRSVLTCHLAKEFIQLLRTVVDLWRLNFISVSFIDIFNVHIDLASLIHHRISINFRKSTFILAFNTQRTVPLSKGAFLTILICDLYLFHRDILKDRGLFLHKRLYKSAVIGRHLHLVNGWKTHKVGLGDIGRL